MRKSLAAALEASARRSEARAAHASAATALLRVSEPSVEESRRTQRLAAAAATAWHAGQPDRARATIARAAGCRRAAEGPAAATEWRNRGALWEPGHGPGSAARGRRRQFRSVLDPGLLGDAAEAAIFSGQIAKAAELCARAECLPATTARDRMMVSVLLGFGRVFSGDHQSAQVLLSEVVREADTLGEPSGLIRAATSASVAGRPGDGLALMNRAVDLARRQGLLSLLPIALQTQSYELFHNGQFELAYGAAEEGYQLSLDVGHGRGWHLTTMAMVEAVWGRESDARRHSEEVLAIGQAAGSTFLAGVGEWTLGFLDLAMGRPDEATGRLLAVTDLERREANPLVALPAIPDAIEAAVRAGRSDQLGGRLAALKSWAETAPVGARRAWLARSQALLGLRPPEEAFGSSISERRQSFAARAGPDPADVRRMAPRRAPAPGGTRASPIGSGALPQPGDASLRRARRGRGTRDGRDSTQARSLHAR